MLTPRANTHHSKMPQLGAIVVVRMRPLAPGHRFRRFIVESFPLSDAASRHSRGIHTCTIRALDNGQRFRIAGHWCEEIDQ